jgi:hypothetical protein
MSQLLTLSFPSSRPFEVLKNIYKIKIKKFLILFLTPLKHMKAIDIAIKINEIKNKIILNHQGSKIFVCFILFACFNFLFILLSFAFRFLVLLNKIVRKYVKVDAKSPAINPV